LDVLSSPSFFSSFVWNSFFLKHFLYIKLMLFFTPLSFHVILM
jgi:hypothetical protein